MLLFENLNKGRLKLQKRLSELTADSVQKPVKPKKKELRFSSKIASLFGGNTLKKIENELALAGILLKAEEFVVIMVITALLLPLLGFLISGNLFVALGIAIFGTLVPPLIVSKHKKKRMMLFETQLTDALAVISNCLRAGFTFSQALESIVSEMPDPISKEFGKALREVQLGIPMETALQHMQGRLRHDDLGLLVSAVVIQRQVGGNLAEILDNIGGTIKERLRIRGEIKVLTSSGRTSGMVIGLLPVFLLAVLMVLNPSYVSMFFTTTLGLIMLCVAVAMEITGFLIVRKIVNIKF